MINIKLINVKLFNCLKMGNQESRIDIPLSHRTTESGKQNALSLINSRGALNKTHIKLSKNKKVLNQSMKNKKIPTKPSLDSNDLPRLSVAYETDSSLANQIVKSRLISLPGLNLEKQQTDKNDKYYNLKQRLSDTSLQFQITEVQFSYGNRGRFFGETNSEVPNGLGKLYLENGDYLEGLFFQGRCSGEGRYIKADGSFYQGQMKNNEANGFGIYEDKSGFKYQGMWKSNEPNGQGEAIYEDGSRYVGEFLNNKRNGRGIYMSKGDIFEGEFQDNVIHGQCNFYGANGDKFSGEWKKGIKHGKGTFQWADGNKYEGEYQNDMREGFGKMYYSNGEKYEGMWKRGKKEGPGKFISAKEEIHGVWVKGALSNTFR